MEAFPRPARLGRQAPSATVMDRHKKSERTLPARNAHALHGDSRPKKARCLDHAAPGRRSAAALSRIVPAMREGATGTSCRLAAGASRRTYRFARSHARRSQRVPPACKCLPWVAPLAPGRPRAGNRSLRVAETWRLPAPVARSTGRCRLTPFSFIVRLRSFMSAQCPASALNSRPTQRASRQSACLRRNAGMSYVSTPFSCSA